MFIFQTSKSSEIPFILYPKEPAMELKTNITGVLRNSESLRIYNFYNKRAEILGKMTGNGQKQ